MQPRTILDIFYTDAGQKLPFKVRKISQAAENLGYLVLTIGTTLTITDRLAAGLDGIPQWADLGGDLEPIVDSESWTFVDDRNIHEPSGKTVDIADGYIQSTVADKCDGLTFYGLGIGRCALFARGLAYVQLGESMKLEAKKKRGMEV